MKQNFLINWMRNLMYVNQHNVNAYRNLLWGETVTACLIARTKIFLCMLGVFDYSLHIEVAIKSSSEIYAYE